MVRDELFEFAARPAHQLAVAQREYGGGARLVED